MACLPAFCQTQSQPRTRRPVKSTISGIILVLKKLTPLPLPSYLWYSDRSFSHNTSFFSFTRNFPIFVYLGQSHWIDCKVSAKISMSITHRAMTTSSFRLATWAVWYMLVMTEVHVKLAIASAPGLRMQYYDSTNCPNVEARARQHYKFENVMHPTLAGAMLRMVFHDCTVQVHKSPCITGFSSPSRLNLLYLEVTLEVRTQKMPS